MTTPLQFLAGARALQGEGQGLPVQLSGSKGALQKWGQTLGSMAAGGSATLLDLDEPCVIDVLEVASNSSSLVQLRILATVGGSEQSVGLAHYEGTNIVGLTAFNLATYGSNLFDIIENDTSALRFKFALARPLEFAEGVKVTVQNNDDSNAKNVAAIVLARTFR